MDLQRGVKPRMPMAIPGWVSCGCIVTVFIVMPRIGINGIVKSVYQTHLLDVISSARMALVI